MQMDIYWGWHKTYGELWVSFKYTLQDLVYELYGTTKY